MLIGGAAAKNVAPSVITNASLKFVERDLVIKVIAFQFCVREVYLEESELIAPALPTAATSSAREKTQSSRAALVRAGWNHSAIVNLPGSSAFRYGRRSPVGRSRAGQEPRGRQD